jgi:predicted ATPase
VLVGLLGARQRARRASSTAAFAPQGVYCHGLPGRGKSLVVDTLFELAPCRKRRLHFHEFLREMNRRLVHAPRGDDRLGEVSRHKALVKLGVGQQIVRCKRALFIASDQRLETALLGLEGAHDLSRTLSRLAEMQSRAYRSRLVKGAEDSAQDGLNAEGS